MRILEVVVRFHPYVGGVEENTVYHLGRRLAARGHEVRVVCAAEPTGAPAAVEGMEVVRLPYLTKVGNTNVSLGLPAALRRERPDLVHTHMPTPWFADFAASASAAHGVPLVLTYHNELVGRGAKGALAAIYNRLLLPRLLRAAARVVVSNPRYLVRSPSLTSGDPKTVHIPWGVDAVEFRPAPPPGAPPFVLGFLSLLDAHHRYKGLAVLLRALAALRDLPLRLAVGGAGEELERYRALAAELGVTERVDFLGFVPGAALTGFFRSCHLFALPSTDGRQEGFGLVLLEAMACGRPVATTPVVGMAGDLAAHGAGVLVPPGDAAALAAALRRLVEERYTWERVTDAYEELFADLT